MNLCDTCPAPCCKFPIISGPNSGTEQAIDWVYSGKGEYTLGQEVEAFVDTIRSELERLTRPPAFFSGTQKPQRELQLHGIEGIFDLEMRLFLFRVIFLCPEFDTQTSRCRDYEDRPRICRDFLCEDAGGPYESREKIANIKDYESKNFFASIEETLTHIRHTIQQNFL